MQRGESRGRSHDRTWNYRGAKGSIIDYEEKRRKKDGHIVLLKFSAPMGQSAWCSFSLVGHSSYLWSFFWPSKKCPYGYFDGTCGCSGTACYFDVTCGSLYAQQAQRTPRKSGTGRQYHCPDTADGAVGAAVAWLGRFCCDSDPKSRSG